MALTQVDQGLLGTYAQYTGYKNRLINGSMNIWQRGTSGFGPGGYGADRWYLDGVSATSSQSSDVPSSAFTYSNSWGYPGTASCSIRQRIESWNSKDLAGQNITVSFWAKSTAGTTSLSYSLDYPTATDNFSSLTNIASFVTIAATPSTSWTYYTFTAAIPSAATTGLQLSFNRNTGGSATTLITGVQLEKGSTATSFDYRPYGVEMYLCQRYYQTYQYAQGFGAGFGMVRGNGTGNINYSLSLRQTMRTTPTEITIPTVGTSANNITFLNGEAYAGTQGSLNTTNATADHIWFYFTGFSTVGTANTSTWAYVTGGSATFRIGAEL